MPSEWASNRAHQWDGSDAYVVAEQTALALVASRRNITTPFAVWSLDRSAALPMRSGGMYYAYTDNIEAAMAIYMQCAAQQRLQYAK